jgi:hypothetical protein
MLGNIKFRTQTQALDLRLGWHYSSPDSSASAYGERIDFEGTELHRPHHSTTLIDRIPSPRPFNWGTDIPSFIPRATPWCCACTYLSSSMTASDQPSTTFGLIFPKCALQITVSRWPTSPNQCSIMSLPSGNFILTNDGDGRVGIQSPVPPVQPIVRVNHNDIVSPMPLWFVQYY